jgi:hypothetical protein
MLTYLLDRFQDSGRVAHEPTMSGSLIRIATITIQNP